MDTLLKKLLRLPEKTLNKRANDEWKKRIKSVCKPCWELKYCPYGSLIEQFPLLGPIRSEAIEHNNFLVDQLKKKTYSGWIKKLITKEVKNFNSDEYPIKHNKDAKLKSCNIFGHQCPVFFVNEPVTETRDLRKIGRNISRDVMIRVVRRDNNQCQECGKLVKDNEIEFDHIIPVSKGGSSEEQNIRLTCMDCNRKKSNKIYLDKR